MAGVVSHRFPTAPGSDRLVFDKHLLPWIGRFFADLEQAQTATFYRAVGRLGRAFIDIETEAFALQS
jgi:TorA maturation chaperone TorD